MIARLNRRRLCLSALAIASVAGTAQAPAQNRPVVVYGEREAVNVERVPYGDLELQARSDRKTLFGRVGRAVRNVCHFDSIPISTDYRTCAVGAWGRARPQINAAIAKSSLALNGQTKNGAFIFVRR